MDWAKELEQNVTTVEELEEKLKHHFTEEEKKKLNEIIDTYPMSVTRFYLSLIDLNDEKDPIRRMCIPSISETDMNGSLDTSGESDNTVVTGLQHKYKQTALILSTNQCAMYCRFCFRKRLVGQSSTEIIKHMDDIISYINNQKGISNVLISGGDSLLNTNSTIKNYLDKLSAIEHLDFIRFGTRVPITFPMRIYEDNELLKLLREYNDKKKIYIITHFNHPNEMTESSHRAIKALIDCGIIIKNQTVLLKGVNDDSYILAELIDKMTAWGIIPYYIFQCRPVAGVKNQFQLPLIKGYKIVEEAKARLNGQGKCFRYVLSNRNGKVEILGILKENTMLFKYHESKEESNYGRVFMKSVEKDQCWID
ncbi:KamA family radical SAM protein [Anaerocolumna sp. MB42-C2]|uniref:KamA family radical SAM protein n=1 Tax=Anaerocolumna sp. MB42-C2 TaxID=3070997 RepID=UPI0027DFD60A|nr:KamA family radical SAM protein [Anaerocolumna sp. MB42-C2]WMJ89391.1 KamA family radical SAM protein [Anaerocolumna sp. MB42-C2]